MPLIFGETASGLMVPVLLESDGTLPITGHGYIGAAWQKNPLLLGYSGDKSEEPYTLSATAGDNTLTGGGVPGGEIWIVEAISALDLTNNPSRVILFVSVNGVNVVLTDISTVVAGQFIVWSGAITLSQGDTVKATIYGCTLNDDIFMQYHARRIDIDL